MPAYYQCYSIQYTHRYRLRYYLYRTNVVARDYYAQS
jgi:hypothetical protein